MPRLFPQGEQVAFERATFPFESVEGGDMPLHLFLELPDSLPGLGQLVADRLLRRGTRAEFPLDAGVFGEGGTALLGRGLALEPHIAPLSHFH